MSTPNNDTWDRVLEAADALFSARGYASVTLRDIAGVLGIKHASLYYYVPGGKEELYVKVMERNFLRHRDGMLNAISQAGGDLRDQLRAVGLWMLSQPPIDMMRMAHADLKEIAPEQARRLMLIAYDALQEPLVGVIAEAVRSGVVQIGDPELSAIAFVTLVQSVHTIPAEFQTQSPQSVVEDLIDMILYGWLKR